MRVLIVGVAGKIGRLLAERLVAEGDEVTGMDRRPWPNAPAGVEHFDVDIRKRAAEDVFRKKRPEAVIHMATVTSLAVRGDERTRINLGGTRSVFEHCHTYEVGQVVFVGRHTFYGAAPDAPLFHTEDEPPMALASFPELTDLVAADLYAGMALWRDPRLVTTVLRMVYTLGPTGHGTLAAFLKGSRVPSVLGFDPLYQFMHESDVVSGIVTALRAKQRGVFNVAGPQPLPLSVIVRAAGRKGVPIPELLFHAMSGRFGLPRLPPGAIDHIKYPVVVDSSAFRRATGFTHAVDDRTAIDEFARAYPARS